MKDFLKAIVYTGAFLVLFVPLMVNDSMFFPYITGKNFAFRILVEIIFASWVVLALLDKDYRPRFSWIAIFGGALLVVMFFANLFGEYPLKSFWSNFERMDGYITLVHFYIYFFVLGHILRTAKMWSYFLHTSLAVAAYTAIYGLGQTTGFVEGRNRVDSTFGNAAYMAIYMLFHIFLVAFVSLRSKDTWVKTFYALLGILFVYILLETGTRGTFVGLLGGGLMTSVYLIIFGRTHQKLRKTATIGLISLVALVVVFFTFSNSSFIQNNDSLRRIAKIDIASDLEVRTTIWGMAFEGFKERPLLGWGQGNFNYVFNREYDPSLYAQEQWFDRVHNLFFDWLIYGGLLGAIAYFGIILSVIYYLFWKPLFTKNEEEIPFSVTERAVLLGLLASYFIHNLAVFDNIVSYIFYAVVLALIHSRVSTPVAQVVEYKIHPDVVKMVVTPVAAVSVAVVIYFAHVPGIMAAQDIIDAFVAQDVETRFDSFERALSHNSFGDQEIVEQLAQQAMNLARQSQIPDELKLAPIQLAERELAALVEQKPNDARLHVFFSAFYRGLGQIERSREQIAIAHSLSPEKQSIIIEQGIIEVQAGNYEQARDFFQEAWELNEDYGLARIFYGSALLYTNEIDKFREIITEEHFPSFALDDFALGAADRSGDTEVLKDMFTARAEARPTVAQNWASLSFLYYQDDEIEEAKAVLAEGIEKSENFTEVGTCYLENIEAGNSPAEGC